MVSRAERWLIYKKTWSNERYPTVNLHLTEDIKRSEIREMVIRLLSMIWMSAWLKELHTCIRQENGEKRGKATRQECLARIRKETGDENLSQNPVKSRDYILRRRYYRAWSIVTSIIFMVDLSLAILCTKFIVQNSGSTTLTTIDRISLILWVVAALLMCMAVMNVHNYFKYQGNKASVFVGRGWIGVLKEYQKLGLIRKITEEIVRSHDDAYGFIKRVKSGLGTTDDKGRITNAFLDILDYFALQCLMSQTNIEADPDDDSESAKNFSLALSLAPYFGVIGEQRDIRINAVRNARRALYAQQRVNAFDEDAHDGRPPGAVIHSFPGPGHLLSARKEAHQSYFGGDNGSDSSESDIPCINGDTTIILLNDPVTKSTRRPPAWRGKPPDDAA